MSLMGLKRVAAFGAGFGAGATIMAAAIIGGVHWYQSRPEPWHANAIVGLSATASQTFNYNPQTREMKPVGFTFNFILENKTGQDYTVPETLKLFRRDKKSQALAEFSGKLDHGYTIPARERADVPLSVEYSCSTFDLGTNHETERDVRTCFDDAVAEVSGFVGLDYGAKIRVELPKPVLASGQAKEEPKASGGKGRLFAPDKGDVFDRVAGCEEADRLLSLCKSKNIKPDQKPWVTYGGFSNPLPTLPIPPAGHKLEASESVCGIAVEWKNFCRQQE